MKLLFKFTIIIIVAVILIGCKQPVEEKYLVGNPCMAPCWEGIVPGVTDELGVIRVVSDPNIVIKNSVRSGANVDASRIDYSFRRNVGGNGEIVLYHGIAHFISLNPARDILLQEVVNTFFHPEFVYVELVSDSIRVKPCYIIKMFELGLIYMNARYYVPSLGRFASADTLVPDPTNPQQFNRFSYVLNNPLRFTDPTGHLWPEKYKWWTWYWYRVCFMFMYCVLCSC
jgi:RHS repeat-associated protein